MSSRSLLRYFTPTTSLPSSGSTPSLPKEALVEANKRVASLTRETDDAGPAPKRAKKNYATYSPEDRSKIGRYAAEHGPTKASRHFTVPESTARLLKKQYSAELNHRRKNGGEIPEVTSLPTKTRGRPLLLGSTLDVQVREYITALRDAAGVVNTAIVVAAAEGIVAAADRSLLRQHGGTLVLTKSWAKSLMIRMGFVKRKGSTAAKLPVAQFEKRREQYLTDIRAAVLMNDIPPSLVINWDQTAIHFVPVSSWMMSREGEKSIPIAGLDDKREITVVLAATLNGEYLPPQILYQGKTERCHPAIDFPPEWDVWHTENHWSNEATMMRYAHKILLPFIKKKKESMGLEEDHLCLTIFDVFRGQQTPAFRELLEKNNIDHVNVPANCTDKLQPLDLSVNKPLKDEMKKRFQAWYAEEVEKQLVSGTDIKDVKVDTRTSILKPKSANWLIGALESLSKKPEIVLNGFRKAGIVDALKSDEQ